MRFVPNDFGYAFEPDVSHDLLWTTGELTDEVIREQIEKHKPSQRCETANGCRHPRPRRCTNDTWIEYMCAPSPPSLRILYVGGSEFATWKAM